MSTAATITPALRIGARWDPSLPLSGQLFAHGWAFCTATRLRRVTLLPLFLQLCFCIVTLVFPAEAHAAFGPQSPLLYALGVTDSYGVPLSRYAISTDYGNVFDLGSQAVMATMLEAEAGLFVVIGGVAIWFLMYVISFAFLPDLVQPVAAVAQDYAGHIIPGVAAIAALVAALFVAINLMRGNTPRAASQAVAALVVAMIGGALVYSPITWVISERGPLAQGRNVAVSLGSNSVASMDNTSDTLNRLEGTLATSFVRRPLQTWNFAGQPDATPNCAAAWSAGVNSGNTDRIKDGIRDCGAPDSAAMKATADNPNPGQLGTGVLLIVFIGVFALFCAVLALHIVMEFFRAVANAFKLLWGFAVGVIPGAPQASLVNTFVAMMFSAVAMFAYITATIFIGEVVTVIFRQQGNGIVAMISALILMVVAIRFVFKVSKGLKQSSANVAAGVLNSVGASPPAPTTNILHEKSSSFLRETGTVALGAGATMAGAKVAQRSPAAAHALELVAPHLRGKTMRNMARGARTYSEDRRDQQIEDIAQAVRRNGGSRPQGPDEPPPAPPTDPGPPSPGPPGGGGNGGSPSVNATSPGAAAGSPQRPAPSQGPATAPMSIAAPGSPPTPPAPPPSPGSVAVDDLIGPPASGGHAIRAGHRPHDAPVNAPRPPSTGSASALPETPPAPAATSANDTSPSGSGAAAGGGSAQPPSPTRHQPRPTPPPGAPTAPDTAPPTPFEQRPQPPAGNPPVTGSGGALPPPSDRHGSPEGRRPPAPSSDGAT